MIKLRGGGAQQEATDTEEVVYFECAACNAGNQNISEDPTKKKRWAQSFTLKVGEYVSIKIGAWIDWKMCPDCGEKTVLRVEAPEND